MNWFVVYLIVCFISSVICYGWYFAYLQREYPSVAEENYPYDLAFSIFFGILYGLLGPLGILITYFINTKFAKHGWKFR